MQAKDKLDFYKKRIRYQLSTWRFRGSIGPIILNKVISVPESSKCKGCMRLKSPPGAFLASINRRRGQAKLCSCASNSDVY
jgi:hypothetical protein